MRWKPSTLFLVSIALLQSRGDEDKKLPFRTQTTTKPDEIPEGIECHNV